MRRSRLPWTGFLSLPVNRMIAAVMMALVRGIYGICYADCTINMSGFHFPTGTAKLPKRLMIKAR